MAGVVLSRLDPALGLPKGASWNVDGPLPRLTQARAVHCALPGGLHYLRVQLPLFTAASELVTASGGGGGGVCPLPFTVDTLMGWPIRVERERCWNDSTFDGMVSAWCLQTLGTSLVLSGS